MRKSLLLPLALALAFASSPAFSQGSSSAPDLESIDFGSGRKMTFSDLGSRDQILLSGSVLKDSQIQALDQILLNKGPQAAIFSIERVPNDPKLILWLQARAAEGHTMLMWELANRMAREKPYESMVWLFSGLISLWRDSSVCVEKPQKAASILSAKYPKAESVSRANPGKTKAATLEAFAKISAISQPPSPEEWLCRGFYPGSEQPNYVPNPRLVNVYAEKHWDMLRTREMEAIRTRLGLPAKADPAADTSTAIQQIYRSNPIPSVRDLAK